MRRWLLDKCRDKNKHDFPRDEVGWEIPDLIRYPKPDRDRSGADNLKGQ